jgi:chromate transporter
MHRILVEEKRWISEARFLHALNWCMLLPGPEAMQLATYIGWLLHGTAGGLVAGGLFVLPGVVSIMALSHLYAALGQTPLVAALFFGLKAAVLAVVVEACLRISRRALKNAALVALAAASFVLIFFFALPFPAIVLGAGLIGLVAAARGSPAFLPAQEPAGGTDRIAHDEARARSAHGAALAFLVLWLAPVTALVAVLGPENVFSAIAVFFSKMAVVTFGGAYAVLAYVAQEAVEQYGWLSAHEMLDGLGMAETTPGPLIMVLQFVGFLGAYRDPGALDPWLAGTLGGLLATWVTFAPCFLWIFAGAPYMERLRQRRALSGALAAITAAVVGVILNLALWFAIHALFREIVKVEAFPLSFDVPVPASADMAAVVLAVAAAVALLRFKAGMIPTLAGACAAGVALHLTGWR